LVFSDIGLWDVMLIIVVTATATTLAYLHDPKFKAAMISLPIPFTLAALAVDRPLDSTNIMGLVLLFCYTHGVRILYKKLHWPIVVSIVTAAIGYCLVGAILVRVLPPQEIFFWISSLIVLSVGILLYIKHPYREEQGHRTSLPVWIKAPIIMMVIICLVLIKKWLGGFMTLFPMVGVVASYEARNSLWTMCRQITVVIITFVPLMLLCRLTQNYVGLALSLVLGWGVFLVIFIPLTQFMWKQEKKILGGLNRNA